MNDKVRGVISAVRKDGKGFQIDGTWYSIYKDDVLKVKKGDEVEFTVKVNGNFNNVRGEIKVVGGGGGNSNAGSGGGTGRALAGGYDIGVAVGHALNCAVHLAGPKAKLQDVEVLAVQVYKLAAKMKAAAAAGAYAETAQDAPFNDDIPDF